MPVRSARLLAGFAAFSFLLLGSLASFARGSTDGLDLRAYIDVIPRPNARTPDEVCTVPPHIVRMICSKSVTWHKSGSQLATLGSVHAMTTNFLRTLQDMAVVVVEKVWNVIVGVIWKTISAVAGLALPIPTHA
jgi:hypothetical protein